MAHAYPLMLDVTDRLVVIVGGGAVAVRKANGLLAAGATRIRAVSTAFREDFPAVAERVVGPYAASHLDGAGLVFAATDTAEVNEAIVRDARARGILVCRADADEDEPGDFATPALLRDGPITVTVSAAGSPALAAAVRDELQERMDPAWRLMGEAMRILRPRIVALSHVPQPKRREAFRDLASAEALDVVRQGGPEAAWHWLLRRHPELDACA